MLAREEEAAIPRIETKDELVADLEAGNKPPADWRIGTEHEKFGFHTRRPRARCPMRASAASARCSRA